MVVSNGTGSLTSRNAQLTVSAAVRAGQRRRHLQERPGAHRPEPQREDTHAGQRQSSGFGKLRFLSTDGKVDAQPLYLSALNIGGAAHNVVFVATENDSVYAFDADNGSLLWKVSLVPGGRDGE